MGAMKNLNIQHKIKSVLGPFMTPTRSKVPQRGFQTACGGDIPVKTQITGETGGIMTRTSDRQHLAIKSHTRQQLSCVCVQTQARLLLDRKGPGEGGAM